MAIIDKITYLDNAATTPVKSEVLEEMTPFLTDYFGNPSSAYNLGSWSFDKIEKSRNIIADKLDVNPNEIYFTSGGSESNNWAIKGVALANHGKGNHIITSKIEHPSVLNTCKYLEKLGFEITYVDVDSNGIVDISQVEKSIKPSTTLISVMAVNNEVGSIQPINEISEIARKKDIYFHTDAVQSFGKGFSNYRAKELDLLSISGHKIGAPKGIGALYIKEGTKIDNLIHGGGQERGMRCGTENVAQIVGLGKATELAFENMVKNTLNSQVMNDMFVKYIKDRFPTCRINCGSTIYRIPETLSITFPNINAETLMFLLSQKNIYVSVGSACHSKSSEPSHVLTAMGLSEKDARSTIRISFDGKIIPNFENILKEICDTVDKMYNS